MAEPILVKIQDQRPSKDHIWEDDVLDREKVASFLTKLLTAVNTQYVLQVNSPWGTGKTFFLQRWELSIKGKNRGQTYTFDGIVKSVCLTPRIQERKWT